MKENTKLENLIFWIDEIPQKIKQVFCSHKFEIDARDVIQDKWERVSGGSECVKCGKYVNYTVFLFKKP